jgi:hypothetical protein
MRSEQRCVSAVLLRDAEVHCGFLDGVPSASSSQDRALYGARRRAHTEPPRMFWRWRFTVLQLRPISKAIS